MVQKSADTSDREIVSTRVLKASPAEVFAAFRDPARLAEWWGPSGFTNTFETFDFRPGGEWKFVMHGPDGKNYVNESVFEEIDEPKTLVFLHLRTMHRFRMTMTFDEQDGGTKLTWRMVFDTAEECGRVKVFTGQANEQNFDRLEANIATG